jgi:uncharacterized protein
MRYLLYLFLIFNLATLRAETVIIETLYGCETVEDPLIVELIQSSAMQRLQGIDQSGIIRYLGKIGPYTRYIHSLGVYLILKKFNVSLEEQVAGLLHDTSHTVFSHIGDWLYFDGSHDNAYQDKIHAWHLSQSGLKSVLEKHGMTLKQALAKDNGYQGLEQNLPDLCADRLEYNLFTGHLMGLFTQEEVRMILEDVHYANGKWYFEDPVLAGKLARASLFFTKELFCTPWNAVSYEILARILKRGLEIGLWTVEDIHFGTDALIFEKIGQTDDLMIREWQESLQHLDDCFVLCEAEEADFQFRGKLRAIDPLVYWQGQFVRLSVLDQNFAKEYEAVKEYVKRGLNIKFVK